jgi:hypothetical protein
VMLSVSAAGGVDGVVPNEDQHPARTPVLRRGMIGVGGPPDRPLPDLRWPDAAHPGRRAAGPRRWVFEPKWDGWRCLAVVDGKADLRSRRATDPAPCTPELSVPDPLKGLSPQLGLDRAPSPCDAAAAAPFRRRAVRA